MKTEKPAVLALSDGSLYHGFSLGAEGSASGELVFNTAMTGYQEILTDPSYAQQIILLTTAHVGNTGVNLCDLESHRIWASGLVVRDVPATHSHHQASSSLSDWLLAHQVVAIAGIDTRALTLKLRDEGAQGACISTEGEAEALKKAQAFKGLDGLDLAAVVSRKDIEYRQGSGPHHVVVYDLGVKENILRLLSDKGCRLTIVPAKTPAETVLAMKPSGILLSNGPGDPKACTDAIDATKTFLKAGIPIFGICLGIQILAWALNAQTKKMKFGHHGANHPVMDLQKEVVFISSQNHGFAVDEQSLPSDVLITHRSLFDGSLQGIKHKTKPAFGFQGHPEAGPGPHELETLFDEFIALM